MQYSGSLTCSWGCFWLYCEDALHLQGLAIAWRGLGEDGRWLGEAQSARMRPAEEVRGFAWRLVLYFHLQMVVIGFLCVIKLNSL